MPAWSTDWNGVAPVKRWVGLANYERLLHDRLVWVSLRHNLIWIVIGTVVPIAIGLFLAVLLAGPTRGATIFRTVYFMPVVLAPSIIAIIWGWIYHPLFGILNRLLHEIGLGHLARGWLGDVRLALEGAPHGIRSNIVNPDAVFQDSKLWSEEIRRERAAAQGITVDQLEDFYRKRNLLGARILPDDVAQSVLFLASDRAAKTTGCTLTVDGGVKDAFPR